MLNINSCTTDNKPDNYNGSCHGVMQQGRQNVPLMSHVTFVRDRLILRTGCGEFQNCKPRRLNQIGDSIWHIIQTTFCQINF